jgi:hypothetical protein
VNGDQAYRFAYANARRNNDGTIVEEHLVELVAHAVDFDPEKERLGLAQRIVSRRKRPGQTAPEGKLAIPGMEPHLFEPHRLLADDAGNVVENQYAREAHKAAEARRAQLAVDAAEERVRLARFEAELIRDWTAAEQAKGRDPLALVWGACVRETGLLTDEVPGGAA